MIEGTAIEIDWKLEDHQILAARGHAQKPEVPDKYITMLRQLDHCETDEEMMRYALFAWMPDVGPQDVVLAIKETQQRKGWR